MREWLFLLACGFAVAAFGLGVLALLVMGVRF